MDAVDERIIQSLALDARASIRKIAGYARVVDATAATRLTRLTESGTVVVRGCPHPLAFPDSLTVGVYIEYESAERIDFDDPVLQHASWVARIVDGPRAIAQYCLSGLRQVAELTAAVSDAPGVRSVNAVIPLRLRSGPGAFSEIYSGIEGWDLRADRRLDEIDIALLRELHEDGRASYTALADRVGLSVATTRRRVLSLIEDGALVFSVAVMRAEPAERALLRATFAAESQMELFRRVGALSGVVSIAELAAEMPFQIDIIASDSAELARIVRSIRGLPGVLEQRVEPLIVVRSDPSWGLPGIRPPVDVTTRSTAAATA